MTVFSPPNAASSRDCHTVDAMALGVPYSSRRRHAVLDILNEPVGQTSIAPPLYIRDVVQRLRRAPHLSLKVVHGLMREAAHVYSSATLAGLSPQDYVRLTHGVTGLPTDVLQRSLVAIGEALEVMPETLRAATAQGAVWDASDSRAQVGCSLFTRRGNVLAVIAAGNGPGIHALWPQAVAMGYRTLVRPSTREPFSAQRMVLALTAAGLGDYVALIPTDHRGADEMVEAADLAIVYGGQEVVDRYGADAKVLVQGPGRSKVVVGRDIDLDEAVSLVAKSVVSLGGAACVSASAVLVEGDAPEFARRLSTAFASMDAADVFPLGSAQMASGLQSMLNSGKSGGEAPWLFDANSSSAYVLRPKVTVVDRGTDTLVQRELPFPCITVAPYDRATDLHILSGSLVVTVLTRDAELLGPIVENPGISNVYVGHVPTTWMSPLVPHDGYLADFLMCNRGLRVQVGWLSPDYSKKDL